MMRHSLPSISTSGGSGRRKIGVAHHRAVGADVTNHDDIVDVDGGKDAIARVGVGAFADRSDDVDRRVGAVAANQRLDAVERVVERRPHQLGHAGIEHDESLRARELFDVDDPGQQHAGRSDQHAAGLDRHLQAAAARGRHQRANVLRRIDDGAAVVRNAEPAAHVEMLQLDALAAQIARQRDHRFGRLAERIERGDLRADVDVRADRQQAAARRHLAKQRRRLVDRHAELVRLQPGGNVRMAPRVDVGIDAQRDARRRILRDRALIDAIELAWRFDVDRQQPERHRAIDLRRALADAGEHDLIGTKAAAHRDVDFAERIGIGVAAQLVQQPDDRRATNWP